MAIFEWYASNTKISYPFQDHFGDLNKMVVDAYVVHNQQQTLDKRLKITVFNPGASRLKLEFEDATVLADLIHGVSNVTMTTSVFGSYTIYEWKKITPLVDYTELEVVAKIVILTSEVASVTPTNAYLLPSLVNPRMAQVRRIGVKQPALACCTGGGFSQGHVVFESGSNVDLSTASQSPIIGLGLTTETTIRTPRVIVVDATAGGGSGAFQECEDAAGAIRFINSVGPNEQGNFSLQGDDCVWTERPTSGSPGAPTNGNTDFSSAISPASLKINNDCKVCCSCEDYGLAYEKIAQLWDRAKLLADQIEQMREEYNSIVLLIRSLRENKCTEIYGLHLGLISRPDFHVAVGVTVINNTSEDLPSVLIQMGLEPSTNFLITAGSGFLDTATQKRIPYYPTLFDASTAGLSGMGLQITVPHVHHGDIIRYSFEGRYGRGASGGGPIPLDYDSAIFGQSSGQGRASLPVRMTVKVSSSAGTLLQSKTTRLFAPLLKD